MKRSFDFAGGFAVAVLCAIVGYAAFGRFRTPAMPMATKTANGTTIETMPDMPYEPRGVLSDSLGRYLTIEGVRDETWFQLNGLKVDTLNGKKLDTPVTIEINNAVLLPGNQTRCVLKGYENGYMYGRPPAEYAAAKERGEDAEALRKEDQIAWHWNPYFFVLIAAQPEGLELRNTK
jgi:hypothetical protein